MKLRASLVASFLALAPFTLTPLAFAQQPKASGEDVVAESGALTTRLREKADKARTNVESAIAKAAKAGILKTSTEAYYRDVLARFKPVAAGLPTIEGLYYPPRFDTSAEMEPVNLAWDDLHVTMDQIEKEVVSEREKLSRALGEAIEQAARTAEKPDDLDTARKLANALQQLPETSSRPIRSPLSMSQSDAVARVLTAMNAALEALAKKDYPAMALALQRVNGTSYGSSDLRLAGIPLSFDAAWNSFRERLSAVPRTVAIDAERAVEKAILAKKPAAECERLIGEFDTRAQEVERLLFDPSNRMSSGLGLRSDSRIQLITAFRGAVQLNALIAGESDDSGSEYRSNPNPVLDGPFAMSPEFRTFLSSLSSQRAAAQRAARDRTEKARVQESQRQQKKAEEDAREQQQKLVAENEARLKVARDKVREQLKGVTKPEDLLAVADGLTALSAARDSRYADGQENWITLQMELRQIAAWWADPVAFGENPAQVQGYERGQSLVFAAELRDLRDRALRQIFTDRFKAPELSKPPLADLAPRAAAEQLADLAGQKGDWLRAYDILRVLATPNRYGVTDTSSSGERLAAIKSYLVGRNMELAGQYRDAVTSYRAVLSQLGANLPTKETAERLQALQKEHPEAFAAPKPGE